MAEVLVKFSEAVTDRSGATYTAQVCGREANEVWEGWIEFIPNDPGAEPLRTARETTQPNRVDLRYWASGLTVVFLEGALERAKAPTHQVRSHTVDAEPRFSEPAPATRPETVSQPPRAVLNPFEVYAQGEDVLRQELTALDAGHLRNVLLRYGSDTEADLAGLRAPELRERVLLLARRGATTRSSGETRIEGS